MQVQKRGGQDEAEGATDEAEGLLKYGPPRGTPDGAVKASGTTTTSRRKRTMSLGNLGDLGNLDLGQLQPLLQGVNFPAGKEEVASQAEGNGAPQDLVSQIRNSATERFGGPQEVLQAVQGSR